ncbi:alpha/beta hydrolase [Amycolatopsis antarctica]|uniref:Alpha/beta hydrolase n=1 Tax=Amycolatopsis antarctica TaxID=1854586 RepID=A0A263CZT3_9PSEU|nr:alpha/beta hydrolase [Amycolatopsis antarctica]OZM70907.1 alpha/beta hydrolase [Amycolatopsis antarctica]
MSTDTTAPHSTLDPPAPAGVPGTPTAPDVTEYRLTFGGFEFVGRLVRRGGAVTAPLVILGGSSQDRFSWIRHQNDLAPLCDVVTVDLPGYGDADALPATYGLDFLAAAVRHLVRELELGRVNLLGGCFGGAIAMRFAQHYPADLERLILVGMTTYVPPEYAEAAVRWVRMLDDEHQVGPEQQATMAEELVSRFMAPPGTGTIARHAAISRLIHRQFMSQTPRQIKMGVADHNERLMNHEWYRPEPVPPLPALVFTGEHDNLATPSMGRVAAGCVPGAVFTTVKDADHLVHMERIEQFTDLVGRFLTDRPIDDLPYCNPVERPAA